MVLSLLLDRPKAVFHVSKLSQNDGQVREMTHSLEHMIRDLTKGYLRLAINILLLNCSGEYKPHS